jgi:hypothetical protein
LYLGPYRITKVNPNDRFELEKLGSGEGAIRTMSAIGLMKPWPGFDKTKQPRTDATSGTAEM